jgi:hypothetical protein
MEVLQQISAVDIAEIVTMIVLIVVFLFGTLKNPRIKNVRSIGSGYQKLNSKL